MAHIGSKSQLAMALSRLKVFDKAKVRVEQYPTDPEIAAAVLWDAGMRGEIEGKVMADLGSGTGILGIGALLTGAARAYFIESDSEAMQAARDNLNMMKSEFDGLGEAIFMEMDVSGFDRKSDIVVMNPPFGTKEKHADRKFLLKAMDTSDVIYSFHKENTIDFVEKLSADHGFRVSGWRLFDFPIKASMEHHRKRVEMIKVGCGRIERIIKEKNINPA